MEEVGGRRVGTDMSDSLFQLVLRGQTVCGCVHVMALSLGGETLRLQTPMVGLLGESAVILPL